jgi:hypothetical protein
MIYSGFIMTLISFGVVGFYLIASYCWYKKNTNNIQQNKFPNQESNIVVV